MKEFDEQIEKVLREKSEWPGSPDVLWEKVASQINGESRRNPVRRRSLWIGASAAATMFLAFMLRTMLFPPVLPPVVPENLEMMRMQTFSAVMLPEPEIHHPGEPVELILTTYPIDGVGEDQGLRLLIWQETESGPVLVEEVSLLDEEVHEQDSILIQSPLAPGLYSLVVEGNYAHGDKQISVFGEKTILLEGERTNDEREKN
ncbi:MAG: hypothetical protein GX249_02815 [Firmicutes bacterium]|mgnify:FL=1|nr:hypothetical protein [Bacillota bacterium]